MQTKHSAFTGCSYECKDEKAVKSVREQGKKLKRSVSPATRMNANTRKQPAIKAAAFLVLSQAPLDKGNSKQATHEV